MSRSMSLWPESEQANIIWRATTTPGSPCGGGDDLVDVDVVGDVAAAVADVDADPALGRGHAGTFAFSR